MVPWIHFRQLRRLAYLFFATHIAVTALEFTEEQINEINQRLADSAKAPWELGTMAQTILERSAKKYSVFSGERLPPPSHPDNAILSALRPVFNIIDPLEIFRQTKINGPQPLIEYGNAGDPASLGVSVLIANLTRGATHSMLDYAGAAKSQKEYLYNLPKWDGAISHTTNRAQLWSDFIYMVPPFLAYYGVMTRDQATVREAYTQIKLYRQNLQTPTGMWKHILGIDLKDDGCWSTGNGWAAAGILRVYSTIKNSEYEHSMQSELQELAGWVQDIHNGMYKDLVDPFIFANYADRPIDQGNFYDAASTALLASTVYRAAKILKQTDHLDKAEKSRQALLSSNPNRYPPRGPSLFPSYNYFNDGGVLHPVVDPYNPSRKLDENLVSAEGQAFVVQLHEAWKDYTNA